MTTKQQHSYLDVSFIGKYFSIKLPGSIIHVCRRCCSDRISFIHQIQNFGIINDQMLRQVLDIGPILRMLSDFEFVLRSNLEINLIFVISITLEFKSC